MERKHKHKGVMSNGKLKLHPVSQNHKDTYAKRCHQLEINMYNRQNKQKPVVKSQPAKKQEGTIEKLKSVFRSKSDIVGEVDKDGYLFVDLTKNFSQKGIRIKFNRQEGRTRRTVGLQIEK